MITTTRLRRSMALAASIAMGNVAGLVAETKVRMEAPVLTARAGDQCVLLHWRLPASLPAGAFHLERDVGSSGAFTPLTVGWESPAYADNAVTNGRVYRYRLVPADHGSGVRASPIVDASPSPFGDDQEFLDFLQYAAFQYFWLEANPANGLIRDRNQAQSPSSIAATGFGLTALGIGIDRGWITREEGIERAWVTLKTFWELPQGEAAEGNIGHRGWFYHFLDLGTGLRTWKCELSTIDTALLMAGVLTVKNYFDGPSPREQSIRQLAQKLFDRIDWGFPATGANSLSMGWRPETGFIESRWVGYNEAMILYLLGMGASEGRLSAAYWSEWVKGYEWRAYYGQEYVVFAPLFGHQYSHSWIDFRGIADETMRQKGITYFDNSRRATLAQRAYCIANPGGFKGYGESVWGLTACDGPGKDGFFGYIARGAPPAENDDGTIAPTAVGGSLPFVPEHCLPTLRHWYAQFRSELWTGYGFRDAFNLTANWWGPDVLGIDQGAILLMAENFRSQSVWEVFMREPIIRRGLTAAGFAPIRQATAGPSAATLTPGGTVRR